MENTKKMTKYTRNFKFNVSYASVGEKFENASFCKAFINSQFAEQFIKDNFENNPQMQGTGMYFVAFDSFPLFTVEYADNEMIEKTYYGTAQEEQPVEVEVNVEEPVKVKVGDKEVETEIHDVPKKQVSFNKLWDAWQFKYAADYTISQNAAKKWLKAYPAFFASAESAADSLRDYVVELMKED